VPLLAYSYASGVVGTRLAANKHFSRRRVVWGAIGWFVGDYVYGKRQNGELDRKPSIAQTILDHLRIGGDYPAVPINKP
jgi:hypothetical protein